jgi:predicted DNA-binding ribbon-helix-helix protein
MPVMQPPTEPMEVSDPNNIAETFVNGPFNIVKAGGLVHLTFTVARPNTNDLLKGSTMPGFQATVTCRLLMPLEMAEQLSRTLAETSKAAQPTGTTPEIIKLPDPPEKNPRPRETGTGLLEEERAMKSPIVKRSIVIDGHNTSVSLEDAFWDGLRVIAKDQRKTLSDLASSIDTNRKHGNLSSALRLFVLAHYQAQAASHLKDSRRSAIVAHPTH